jgi:hypothetical protein
MHRGKEKRGKGGKGKRRREEGKRKKKKKKKKKRIQARRSASGRGPMRRGEKTHKSPPTPSCTSSAMLWPCSLKTVPANILM